MTGQDALTETVWESIGRGRSGSVYRGEDAGRFIARKVFIGEALSKLVLYIFSGAPNPYTWCEPAIRCAVLRRNIVEELVRYWFGDAVRVADALDHGWNEGARAFHMDLEFVEGRPAALCHPHLATSEYFDLTRQVMRPLQRHLQEAGFDGLVWQAGRGNPVALNNFLREDTAQGSRWAWIDLESGVPALFPINPVDLFSYYLPRSWRHGRALFDDVDCERLRSYVRDHAEALRDAIGADRLAQLGERIDALESEQDAWRSLPRVARSIAYRLRRGEITEAQAEWYLRRPLRWYSRELVRGLGRGVRAAWRGFGRVIGKVLGFNYLLALGATARFLVSQGFRADIARRYVAARIERWCDRARLAPAHAESLGEHLRTQPSSAYITDFGVHLAVKPVVKLFQWGVIPVLIGTGTLGPLGGALCIAFGGMAVRSAYTLGRTVQAAIAREPLPWIALLVGTLPVAGNAAYPVEVLYRGDAADEPLAGFIIYDTFTMVGEKAPIWGGPDSAVEHWLNQLADIVVRRKWRKPSKGC